MLFVLSVQEFDVAIYRTHSGRNQEVMYSLVFHLVKAKENSTLILQNPRRCSHVLVTVKSKLGNNRQILLSHHIAEMVSEAPDIYCSCENKWKDTTKISNKQ